MKSQRLRSDEFRRVVRDLLNITYRSSPKELAYALEVDPSTISRWVAGHTQPTRRHMEAVMKLRRQVHEQADRDERARVHQLRVELEGAISSVWRGLTPMQRDAVRDHMERGGSLPPDVVESLLTLLIAHNLGPRP